MLRPVRRRAEKMQFRTKLRKKVDGNCLTRFTLKMSIKVVYMLIIMPVIHITTSIASTTV